MSYNYSRFNLPKSLVEEANDILNEAKKPFDVIKHLKTKGFFDIQRTGNTYYTKFPDHVRDEFVDLHRKGLIKSIPEVRGIRSREVD